MANADAPRGAVPVGPVKMARVYVANAAIYKGDFVKQKDTGEVEVAAATNALLGVALETQTTAGGDILICVDPMQEYRIQSDSDDIDALTDIGQNYNIVAGSPNTTYGISTHELDGDSAGATATLPLKLLRIDSRADNAYGASVDCIVKINNHQLGSHTGTAGV